MNAVCGPWPSCVTPLYQQRWIDALDGAADAIGSCLVSASGPSVSGISDLFSAPLRLSETLNPTWLNECRLMPAQRRCCNRVV